MSKMFSVVTLASDSGLLEEYYAPGSPDCAEDLLEDEIIRDDLRSLPKSDRVYAEVGTYSTGKVKQNEPAKKNWPISAKTLKNCMLLFKWTGSAGTVLDLRLRMCCRTILMSRNQNWRTRMIWNCKLRQGKRVDRLLLPIIMILVCVLLGGGTLLFLKFSERRKKARAGIRKNWRR